MEETEVKIQLIIDLYSNRLAQAEHKCILLEAENLTLKDELKQLKGGDCCGKDNDNTGIG